ncbi:NmrA family NAD(P)-binding protein [Pleomorphomonas carboxyditropha]
MGRAPCGRAQGGGRTALTLVIGEDGRGPILVTGATGAQGATTIDALLMKNVLVRAPVLDRQSKRQGSARRGVGLVQGDFDDEDSLARAMEGRRRPGLPRRNRSPRTRCSTWWRRRSKRR